MSLLPRLNSPSMREPLSPGRPSNAMERAEERIEYPAVDDWPSTEEDVDIEMDSLPGEEELSEAVRVYPVAAPPRDRVIVTWEAGTLDVDTQDTHRVTQIASRNRGRRRLFVRNYSLANVYLVPTRETLPFLGFALRASQEVEITHNDDVWVYAEAGGSAASITWLAEYEVEERDADNG